MIASLLCTDVTCAPAAKLDGSSAEGGGRGETSAIAGVGAVLKPVGSPSPDDRKISSTRLSFEEEGQLAHECPPCESLFGDIAGTERHVSVILRGVSRLKIAVESRTQRNSGTRSTVNAL